MATDMHIISIGALPVQCQTPMYTHQFQTTYAITGWFMLQCMDGLHESI